jgi:hypothetical protein
MDFLSTKIVFPIFHLEISAAAAKPNPVIDKNILLTRIGVEKPDPGEEDIPLNIAKGVAIIPKSKAKCATLSVIETMFLLFINSYLHSACSKKHRPAIAKEPTTSSVVIT